MATKEKTAKPKKKKSSEEESELGEVYYNVKFVNCTIEKVMIVQSGKPPGCPPGGCQ